MKLEIISLHEAGSPSKSKIGKQDGFNFFHTVYDVEKEKTWTVLNSGKLTLFLFSMSI
jgi:hypothetical protein